MTARQALEGVIDWWFAVQLTLAGLAMIALLALGLVIFQVWKENR